MLHQCIFLPQETCCEHGRLYTTMLHAWLVVLFVTTRNMLRAWMTLHHYAPCMVGCVVCNHKKHAAIMDDSAPLCAMHGYVAMLCGEKHVLHAQMILQQHPLCMDIYQRNMRSVKHCD